MKSRFRLLGHPVHPMLVVLPSSIFPLLLLLDVVHFFSGHAAAWDVGVWLAGAGVITTLVAMVPGIVDMAHIPDETRAHRTALIHAVVGGLTLLAYAAGTFARYGAGTDRFAIAAGIDVAGVLLVTLQGWLGGELVYKHQVGVLTETEGADPVVLTDAPGGPSAPAPAPRRRDARP